MRPSTGIHERLLQRAPAWSPVRGDAFHLPLRDECIDVIVADPPYKGVNRGKKWVKWTDVEYIPYLGRWWYEEAWRVLKPSGHFYLFCAMREIPDWLAISKMLPVDIIAWNAPNAASLSAYWRRGTGGRAPTWRPILHFQKEPAKPLQWPGGFVQPNSFEAPLVQSNMHEALPWPNQLPIRLLKWLLAPHEGVVLDLFCGTATTAEAGVALGLATISIDKSLGALGVAKRRFISPPLFTLDESEGLDGKE